MFLTGKNANETICRILHASTERLKQSQYLEYILKL